MQLIREIGKRGGIVHIRRWKLDHDWEMSARQWGSGYKWRVYRGAKDHRDCNINSLIFHTKRDALDFYRAFKRGVKQHA